MVIFLDSTITLAFLVTLVSVISPILTSTINKRYELQLRSAELKKEALSSNYERMYSTFKTFITNTSVVVLRFDSDKKPTIQEFKQFETSCLECFLFLDETERDTFQDFRIHIKTQMGYEDPRPNFVLSETIASQMQSILSIAYGRKENKTYKKFNKCIDIANEKLEKVSREELHLLSSDHKENKLFDSIHSVFLKEENTKDKIE